MPRGPEGSEKALLQLQFYPAGKKVINHNVENNKLITDFILGDKFTESRAGIPDKHQVQLSPRSKTFLHEYINITPHNIHFSAREGEI